MCVNKMLKFFIKSILDLTKCLTHLSETTDRLTIEKKRGSDKINQENDKYFT
jgi:hypothetical protein